MPLTSLANVKQYLSLTSTGADALIRRMINAESLSIERYTGRRFGYFVNAGQRRNGTGTAQLVLPDQPVRIVSAVTIGAVELPVSTDGVKPGYAINSLATGIALTGDKFPQGFQNVFVSYEAGYKATETALIPAGNTPTLQPTDNGFALVDMGVTANGVALANVTPAAPLADQYTFAEGVYTFNAANSGQTAAMTFSFAPSDVEQACIEMVALNLRQKDSIGVSSKTLAGESITYEKASMSTSVKAMLQPYRSTVPL